KCCKPEDIDIVIITHLHFDHAANVGMFPHAQFILQKKEWLYAKAPLPIQQGMYSPELISELESYDLLLVDDNYEVAEGVKVIQVPGHTKGQQAVAVNTSAGTYVIAGDLLYSYINIFPERDEITDLFGNGIPCTPLYGHAFYPPGIHTDLSDWYDSVWKVLAIAGSRHRIIPGHDPALIGKVFPDKTKEQVGLINSNPASKD
ncbi:MAG TPA: N-acyl homoserine lactonase family protein, partial [Bacillota bacterium]|nr:N-acyl homoserine lactonase family protein [Bacillota bacterium]